MENSVKNITKNFIKNITKNVIISINDSIKTDLFFTISHLIVIYIFKELFHFNSVLHLVSLLVFFLVFSFKYIHIVKNIKIIN